jgi:antitoxin HicB
MRWERMVNYPARLIPAEDGMVLVTFPDVPEAVACGQGEEEALDRAKDVLETILACYRGEGRALPQPSDIRGAPLVATGMEAGAPPLFRF